MKSTVLFLIMIYQKIISYILKSIVGTEHVCRFSPTCSEYARVQITEKGILKGGRLAFIRLLKCQPFYNKQAI